MNIGMNMINPATNIRYRCTVSMFRWGKPIFSKDANAPRKNIKPAAPCAFLVTDDMLNTHALDSKNISANPTFKISKSGSGDHFS